MDQLVELQNWVAVLRLLQSRIEVFIAYAEWFSWNETRCIANGARDNCDMTEKSLVKQLLGSSERRQTRIEI